MKRLFSLSLLSFLLVSSPSYGWFPNYGIPSIEATKTLLPSLTQSAKWGAGITLGYLAAGSTYVALYSLYQYARPHAGILAEKYWKSCRHYFGCPPKPNLAKNRADEFPNFAPHTKSAPHSDIKERALLGTAVALASGYGAYKLLAK